MMEIVLFNSHAYQPPIVNKLGGGGGGGGGGLLRLPSAAPNLVNFHHRTTCTHACYCKSGCERADLVRM